MSYEQQLNITTEQLRELERKGVYVGLLAGHGFKYDPEIGTTLDSQIDYFSECCSVEPPVPGEDEGNSCDEMEALYYERQEISMEEL